VACSVADDRAIAPPFEERCRPDRRGARRYAPAVTEYRVRSWALTLGQVALAAIALLVAAGLATIPTGSARALGVIGALAVVVLAAFLIRSLRRQAILLDGDRLGWRRGLTSKVTGWTDLDDVEAATVAKVSTSIKRKRPDVILWTRVGGLRGVNAILLRPQLTNDVRRSLDQRAGSTDPLHPFIVPLSAVRPDDRTALLALLDSRGLLPS
jgi:hypothetical protein